MTTLISKDYFLTLYKIKLRRVQKTENFAVVCKALPTQNFVLILQSW